MPKPDDQEPRDRDSEAGRRLTPDEIRERLRDVSPEFMALTTRWIKLAAQLGRQADLAKLDASLFAGKDPAEAAALCRGQAGLVRESSAMQAQMADLYDELADYFDRKSSNG